MNPQSRRLLCRYGSKPTWKILLPVSFYFALFAASLACTGAAAQKPANIKTVYIMPSSHWDLGFVAPPEQILPRLKPHIDEVIANAKADPEFRWTIESAWQVREWLNRTQDPKQIQEFADLVNKGQIQLSASWGSMHSEFMGAEELNRLPYDRDCLVRSRSPHHRTTGGGETDP